MTYDFLQLPPIENKQIYVRAREFALIYFIKNKNNPLILNILPKNLLTYW